MPPPPITPPPSLSRAPTGIVPAGLFLMAFLTTTAAGAIRQHAGVQLVFHADKSSFCASPIGAVIAPPAGPPDQGPDRLR